MLGKQLFAEYIPYLDECCEHLSLEPEQPTDSLLVSLVRLQEFAIRAKDALWKPSKNLSHDACQDLRSTAVAATLNELDEYVRQLPASLKENRKQSFWRLQ